MQQQMEATKDTSCFVKRVGSLDPDPESFSAIPLAESQVSKLVKKQINFLLVFQFHLKPY